MIFAWNIKLSFAETIDRYERHLIRRPQIINAHRSTSCVNVIRKRAPRHKQNSHRIPRHKQISRRLTLLIALINSWLFAFISHTLYEWISGDWVKQKQNLKLEDSAFFRTQSYITEICCFEYLPSLLFGSQKPFFSRVQSNIKPS